MPDSHAPARPSPTLQVEPAEPGTLHGQVAAPPSKSHAIRLLVLACLADGVSSLTNVPQSADVLHTINALRSLGFGIDDNEAGAVVVTGAAGRIPRDTATLDVGGSGTAARFLLAVCALGAGPYRLGGDETLERRPVGALLPALRALGATVATTSRGASGPSPESPSESPSESPPLVVEHGLRRDGNSPGEHPRTSVVVDGAGSSHPVSALLLIGAALPSGLVIEPSGEVVSRPYVDMTVRVLRDRGVAIEERPDGGWRVPPGIPEGGDRVVDGDWSSAAFMLGAAAATGGEVRVRGLPSPASQADGRVLEVLRAFGAHAHHDEEGGGVAHASGPVTRPVDVDLANSPDLAPLVGALACLVPGRSRVRGAAHLRTKETDRIAAVVASARALGCVAEERPDGFVVTGLMRSQNGRSHSPRARIDPRRDHRIAMAFAVAGLGAAGAEILTPECIGKSYPAFATDLAALLCHE